MPYFNYTAQAPEYRSDRYWIHFYWEVPSGGTEPATPKCIDEKGRKGQTSSSSYKTNYEMLPRSLKSCLDYCALLRSTFHDYNKLGKERIVRLMVAEGLIEKKGSKDSLEEVASSLIDELVVRGMLLQYFSSLDFMTLIEIPATYYGLCVKHVEEEDFVSRNDHTPLRVYVDYYYGTGISSQLENLPIQSLFFSGGTKLSDQPIIDTICGLRSLLVLHWVGWVDDHISLSVLGKLVNLKLLSLSMFHSSLSTEISPILSNFGDLQTLEFSSEFYNKVPEEVTAIKALRHLSSFEFQLPKGIRKLVNLQTLVVWDARSKVIDELSSLNQLRRLDVHHVADENIGKLLECIGSMKKLTSLSMRAEFNHFEKCSPSFPLLDPFLPPPHLQELLLEGTLMDLPDWFNSLKNLTTLVIKLSYLSEDEFTVFQFLPNLKFLCLNSACKAEFIGKEFCGEGGFRKLETLEIRSSFLAGWTEIVEGAFPSLTSLLCYAPMLRFFPQRIQHVPKLERLQLIVHEDLIRRLNGDENYKIKHIPSVSISFNKFKNP